MWATKYSLKRTLALFQASRHNKPVFSSFLFSLASFLIVPGIIVGLVSKLRKRSYFTFPVALLFHFSFFSFFAALTRDCIFGYGKLIGIIVLSAGLTYFILRKARFHFGEVLSTKLGFKGLAYLFAISLLICIDLILIYASSGWGFENPLFRNGLTYFRPPFTHDIWRNVAIIKALIRHEGSPYLPHAPFAYQLLWYHMASIFTFFYSGVTQYRQVCGIILSTAFLFTFLFLWFLSLLRPAMVFRKIWLLAISILLFCHADLYYAVLLVLKYGKIGMEADWAATNPLFFRFASLKSTLLISPQHTVFLMSVIGVFAVRRLKGNLDELLILISFVSSPLLSVMFFPFLYLSELIKKRQIGICLRAFKVLIFSFVLHSVVLGYSPAVLFLRSSGPSIFFPTEAKDNLLALPFLWVGAIGILGVVLSAFFLKSKKMVKGGTIPLLFALPIVFHFAITNSELRRYSAIITSFVGSIFVFVNFPSRKTLQKSMPWRQVLILTCGGTLLLHSYFIFFYMYRASLLDTTIAWEDYFAMNAILKNEKIAVPLVAAYNTQLGIEKPIALEVTTAIAAPVEIAIHTQITPKQLGTLTKMNYYGDIVPYSIELGYERILWGPVEEQTWGNRIKDRFIREENLIYRTGRVSLYTLKDHLQERLLRAHGKTTEYYLVLGEHLREQNWNVEAEENFRKVLAVEADNIRAHLGLGLALRAMAEIPESLYHLKQAAKDLPSFQVSH